MEEIPLWAYLKKAEKTYEEFRRFLFVKLGQDKAKFVKFTTYPVEYQLPMLISFLESKGVPILSAMLYYNYKLLGTPSFSYVMRYMIVWEFDRLEKKIEIDYTPF